MLKGFESVVLNPGETGVVEFGLSRYDLSIWSEEQNTWVAPEPNAHYGVHIGASSRDFRLNGAFALQ